MEVKFYVAVGIGDGQEEIKTNFASSRKQATHNAVEKLFKVVAYD